MWTTSLAYNSEKWKYSPTDWMNPPVDTVNVDILPSAEEKVRHCGREASWLSTAIFDWKSKQTQNVDVSVSVCDSWRIIQTMWRGSRSVRAPLTSLLVSFLCALILRALRLTVQRICCMLCVWFHSRGKVEERPFVFTLKLENWCF